MGSHQIQIFEYVEEELRPRLFGHCMKQLSFWCVKDMECKRNSWSIPGHSNNWNTLPILKKTHLLQVSPSHHHFYQFSLLVHPAYQPLLHLTDIKNSLHLIDLSYDKEWDRPPALPKQTAFKQSANKKQKV
eukprot:Phypoly_transcript_15393.p1 GENE.Phypoly_transcript_15393~~Phypoly_transcript_15393.p1  ORF type:complete len:131 (+),score=25.68 Phypoly_transcript_15393:516-908(+)